MSNIFDSEKKNFLSTYKRIPIDVAYGDGIHLIDKQGKKYLDFFSGLGVNALGYTHPLITKAVSEQISKYAHLSNYFVTDVQVELAELLLKYSGMSKLFLSNSGSEAIEGALKLIRYKTGSDKTIYSLTNSFHGRTYGAMTLTDRQKYKKGFEPLLPGIDKIIYDDINDLKKKVNENTAAVFLEFIQGEGGINEISNEFVKTLKELKDKYGFIFVADEIQSGIGRTGKPFAYSYYDIKPDIVTVAKAIGGGLPLGAFMTSAEFERVFDFGVHGTTFGGNSVSCAAGLVVLKEIFENGLMEKVAEHGNYIFNELEALKKDFPEDIKELRGKGFMIGINMHYDCTGIVEKMRDRQVLVNGTDVTVVRLLPPLVATKKDIDFFLYNFHEVLKSK